ncbi:MAG: orotidine 5'-phosphate decarboxylase, partial [Planctomycetaceae bacterium]
MPRVPLLVPGYGSQGGTSADAAGAFCPDGLGAVVNSSRGINFAWRRPGYQERFGEAKWRDAVAESIREMIADLAENTAAGALKK